MEFKSLEKKEAGKFITRYDITYKTSDGHDKVYEMISRDKDIDSFERLHDRKPDAVVMIMTDESGDRILLNKGIPTCSG